MLWLLVGRWRKQLLWELEYIAFTPTAGLSRRPESQVAPALPSDGRVHFVLMGQDVVTVTLWFWVRLPKGGSESSLGGGVVIISTDVLKAETGWGHRNGQVPGGFGTGTPRFESVCLAR